jgi:hypothetical protein
MNVPMALIAEHTVPDLEHDMSMEELSPRHGGFLTVCQAAASTDATGRSVCRASGYNGFAFSGIGMRTTASLGE